MTEKGTSQKETLPAIPGLSISKVEGATNPIYIVKDETSRYEESGNSISEALGELVITKYGQSAQSDTALGITETFGPYQVVKDKESGQATASYQPSPEGENSNLGSESGKTVAVALGKLAERLLQERVIGEV